MMRVIGVDPGSNSWDIFGVNTEDKDTYFEKIIPTEKIKESPEYFIDVIQALAPFDRLVAPSGFGLPIANVQDISIQGLQELSLQPKNASKIMGLRGILEVIKEKPWNAIVIPGVKHLPTVPGHRKINRIDMGTADKVCSAVVGIKTLTEVEHLSLHSASFMLVEIGSSFSAILAVERGKIIDGIGGSNLMGFRAFGGIDAEIVLRAPQITKNMIYSGGLIDLLKIHPDQGQVNQLFAESLAKGVYSLLPSFQSKNDIVRIFLTGAGADHGIIRPQLVEMIKSICPVGPLHNFGAHSKASAQGAAFIGEGLLGGPSAAIIQNLELINAKGHILDHIYFPQR